MQWNTCLSSANASLASRRQRPPLAAPRQLAAHVERKVEARGEVLQVEAGGEVLLQTSSPSLSPLRDTHRAERIASRKLEAVCLCLPPACRQLLSSVHPYRVGVQSEPGCSSHHFLIYLS